MRIISDSISLERLCMTRYTYLKRLANWLHLNTQEMDQEKLAQVIFDHITQGSQ